MKGLRNLQRAGYVWDVFAYFPCNAGGVRVAARRTPRAADRFARAFGRRNRVETTWKIRYDATLDARTRARS